MKRIFLFVCIFSLTVVKLYSQEFNNLKIDGYRGIWFELNQKSTHGDKYSGALATYTAKHRPLAIFSEVSNKTFFVYGGTTSEKKRHLVCMIGEFNHTTGMVSKPTIVYDKKGVDDPHDNPSITIDNLGYIWVFVSGRAKFRPGLKFKSKLPYNIHRFEKIDEKEMTYPQPWVTNDGIFNFFTKYSTNSGNRQLFYETSKNGKIWSDVKKLAAITAKEGESSGHYQITNSLNKKMIATFFNRHPNGDPDKRTDLYYTHSKDFGKTWTTVDNVKLNIPITDVKSKSRIAHYSVHKKNIYLKDMGFDSNGYPICLYIRSNGHIPGPESSPYEWCITKWNGFEWQTILVTNSDHNYDMGSLYLSKNKWTIIAPTGYKLGEWATGGEVEKWESYDKGANWVKQKVITSNSKYNHSYIRNSVNFKDPFCFFWADGDSHKFSKSELYFGNLKGQVWKLPYNMVNDYEKPININSPIPSSIQKVIPNLKTDIKIYPNPSGSIITIVNLEATDNYTVYDILGKKLIRGTINNYGEIVIKNLKNGVYILKLDNGSIKKIVKK